MAVFSSEEEQRFNQESQEILARFPEANKGAALLEILHLVQEILGWVSDESLALVADLLDLPLVQVHEVRSFYTMYHTEKPGRHLVEVCTNVSCQCQGAQEIVDKISERFSVLPGHTSTDGRVTLKAVECLGSCGSAPMLAHNREYVERLDREKLDELLDEIGRD